MVYFLNASGGIVHCVPESVYQGSAEGNKLFLVSPHAASTEVWAAFRLPDGSVTPRRRLEYAGVLENYRCENGEAACGWSLSLPSSVTAQYGTVRVQFYFLAPEQGQEASAAAQFTVERGIPSELPSAPEADVYADIVAALSALRADMENGYYPARAAVAWNDGHTYGANELVFCPKEGARGSILRSKSAGNTQPPYTGNALNAQYWEIAVDFDTISDDFFAEIQAAQAAAETAEDNAKASETAAQGYADAASGSAGDAASSAEQAAGSATAAGQSASTAESSATQALQSASAASGSAQSAQDSAELAQGYMEQAKDYAKKEYQVYDSFDALPIPGDSAFIYLVSRSGGTENDGYSEYLWIGSEERYEYVGTVNGADLAGYAKTSGSYPNMTVGNATHADSADSAAKATTTLNNTIDLNAMQGAAYWGKRYYGGGSGVANRPDGVNGYALEIIQGDATSTVQVLYSVAGSESSENRPTHYQRSYSAGNSTWSEWEELVTAEGNYPNLTAGEAKGLSKVGSVYADSASRVGWHKFAEVPLSALTAVSGASSYSAIVLVNGLNPYQGGDTANSGIVEVDMRVDGSRFTSSTPPQIKLLSGNVDIQKLCFKRTDTEVGLYINTSSIYVRYSFTVLDERYYLGRSVDAMEFADEYYGAAAPDGAVYATNVNQAAYAQEAAMLDEAYKAGNNSSTSLNGYVKLIDFTADNNWAEKTLRLEFGDDNASNVPQNPCGMEMRVQWNSSVGVSPRAVLLYGDKQIADKLYVSYNPSFTEGEENTVSVYYKVSGGFDMVAYKPLYMTPRQGTDVTGVNFYQPTQSDLIAELPSGNTNTAITALENFRDLRYAKYDADGNDISDTYATKSDLNAGLQRLYPIGSIYFSAVGTNPSELFGFGTWQAWGAGRVPVGVDASQTEFNAVEKTGGEKAHALTINEMPSHTHEISYRPIGDPSDDPFAMFKSEGGITGTYNSPGTELSQDALEANAAGGGQAHNNLQPYITCYMWKRTA